MFILQVSVLSFGSWVTFGTQIGLEEVRWFVLVYKLGKSALKAVH